MLLTHGKKYLNLLSFKNVSKFIPFKFEELQYKAWLRETTFIEPATINISINGNSFFFFTSKYLIEFFKYLYQKESRNGQKTIKSDYCL